MCGYPYLPVLRGLVPYRTGLRRRVLISMSDVGTLLAMLITWLAEGRPRLPSQEESIAFISDIGAAGLKPLFIAGCSVTAVTFVLSFAAERWLRHSGRWDSCLRIYFIHQPHTFKVVADYAQEGAST